MESKGTQVSLMLSDVDKPLEWGAQTLKSDGQVTIYTVNILHLSAPYCVQLLLVKNCCSKGISRLGFLSSAICFIGNIGNSLLLVLLLSINTADAIRAATEYFTMLLCIMLSSTYILYSYYTAAGLVFLGVYCSPLGSSTDPHRRV